MSVVTLALAILLLAALGDTRRKLKPMITGPQDGNMCTCVSEWMCECCAKFNSIYFQFNKLLCYSWIVHPRSYEVTTKIVLQGHTLHTRKFHGKHMPPYCAHLVDGLSFNGCLMVHSLKHVANNKLRACVNASLSYSTFNVLNIQMGCVTVGRAGIDIEDVNEGKRSVPSYYDW